MFGSKFFYVLPKKKVKKLYPRSHEAIFVGYLKISKGYKLWDVTTKKLVTSRDVMFSEEAYQESTSVPVHVESDDSTDTSDRGGDKKVRFESVDRVIPDDKQADFSVNEDDSSHDHDGEEDEETGDEEYHTPTQHASTAPT